MRRSLILIAMLMLLASPGRGAIDPRPYVIPLQPDEKATVNCDWSRQFGAGTTVASFTFTITQRAGTTDADPYGMATQQAPDGITAPITFAPVGRHARKYQVHVLATFANGMKLACNYLLDISEEIIR